MTSETDNIVDLPAGGPVVEKRANFLTILRNAGFRNLWIGQIVSQVGDYFAFLATMVVVSGFSQDAQSITLAVSGMMIAQTLPRLLFGMLSGVFVDRWDRRRTMIVSDFLRSGLALLIIPAFLNKNLLAMYALGFLLSTVGTLFNPAKGALIPKLVPKDQLLSANSLSQTSLVLSMLLGPGIAGLVIGVAGSANTWIAFVIDGLSFVVSAIAIMLIRVPAQEADEEPVAPESSTDAGAVRRVWQELTVGVKALFFNRVMVTVALVFTVTMLGVGAINVLWITFLKTSFGFGQSELAWRIAMMDTFFSLGMIISTVAVGNFLSNTPPKWLIVGGLVGAGAATLPLGYIPNYWVLVALMGSVGCFVGPISTATSTLVQTLVPNNQLGRVGGGMQTISDGATLISMSLAGTLGAAWGIPLVFALGGVMCLLAGAIAWTFIPVLNKKPEDDSSENSEGGPLRIFDVEREAVA